MGIFDSYISFGSVKNKVLTPKEIEKLKNIMDTETREKVLTKYPFVLPYVLNSWSADANINKLVKKAIELMPENVTKLGKGNVLPTPEYVNLAIETQPSIVFELNDDLKNMISIDSFFKAFQKDPTIFACKLNVLRKFVSRTFETFENGEKQKVKYCSNVRNECLKAIRLAMGVSDYHKGYDDFAMQIAKAFKKNKLFAQHNIKDKMAVVYATVINSLIKNQDMRIFALPVEVWKLNNYKPLYLAVKESCKDKSKIKGVLEFVPFDLLPEKVVKKVVATALSINPKIWDELYTYNLASLHKDPYIQYVTYKACKEQNLMNIVEEDFSKKELKRAQNKFLGVLKRSETKLKKADKFNTPDILKVKISLPEKAEEGKDENQYEITL